MTAVELGPDEGALAAMLSQSPGQMRRGQRQRVQLSVADLDPVPQTLASRSVRTRKNDGSLTHRWPGSWKVSAWAT